MELGDALLLLYVVAFVREFFWLVKNNPLAWGITLLVALPVWYCLLLTKRDDERCPRTFWIIVGVPLLLVYGMRVAFPDASFDQLNYHLINGERGLRGLPFTDLDFFPTTFPFNPAPEMVSAMSRYLLGYRLGTVVNYISLLWAGSILYKLTAGFLTNKWIRSFGVLLVLFTEHALFEINNYMVDLLSVPLLLEATLVIVRLEKGSSRKDLLRIAFFFGAAIAFKLTNLALVIPLIIVYGYRVIGEKLTPKLRDLAVAIFIMVAPMLPFTIFILLQTGSPVFPFYNKIFRSPYWPAINWIDPRWGPKTICETLVWPLVIYFKPERTSELAVYSGRLSVIFPALLLCLVLRPPEKSTRMLCVISVLGLILWTLTTGYVRYATYLEFVGGLVFLAVCQHLTARTTWRRFSFQTILSALPWLLLVIQSYVAFTYVYKYEWGMRSTIMHEPNRFYSDARYLLRDRSFVSFLTPEERKLFDNVDVWIESNVETNAVETLLRKDAPILLVCFPHYFETPESLDRFSQTLAQAKDKRIYSLSFTRNLSASLDMLAFRGLEMGTLTPIKLPYYSRTNYFDMVLIEVRLPGQGLKRDFLKATQSNAPLQEEAFKANLSVIDPPTVLTAGERQTIHVRVKNVSQTTWHASGKPDGTFAIRMGNHWLNEQGTMSIPDDARASLVFDVLPGQEVDLPLTITAPQQPGRYILEFDMVQELVAWFGTRGSTTLRIPVRVER